MASIRPIRQFQSYVLLHDFFAGMFKVTDGREHSDYFDLDTKEELVNATDSTFVKLSKQFIKQSQLT